MDSADRRQMLDLLNKTLAHDPAAIAESLRKDLENHFAGTLAEEQDQLHVLTAVGEYLRTQGIPANNLRLTDHGHTISFDTLDFSGMVPNRG